ncbi:MAG TPA: hypothetical protein DD706_16515 [Nitrospiraceae bacterium]|nr:hypothetical protein [Nitrospiraceae bacterium]
MMVLEFTHHGLNLDGLGCSCFRQSCFDLKFTEEWGLHKGRRLEHINMGNLKSRAPTHHVFSKFRKFEDSKAVQKTGRMSTDGF